MPDRKSDDHDETRQDGGGDRIVEARCGSSAPEVTVPAAAVPLSSQAVCQTCDGHGRYGETGPFCEDCHGTGKAPAPERRLCHTCGKPATCFGSYEGHPPAFGCDECCGHGNEDGHCEPLLVDGWKEEKCSSESGAGSSVKSSAAMHGNLIPPAGSLSSSAGQDACDAGDSPSPGPFVADRDLTAGKTLTDELCCDIMRLDVRVRTAESRAQAAEAEAERLREALRLRDTCAVCRGALCGPLDWDAVTAPHCEDCYVEEDHAATWEAEYRAALERKGGEA